MGWAGIGGVLCDSKGEVLCKFSASVGPVNDEDFGNLPMVDVIYDIRILLQQLDVLFFLCFSGLLLEGVVVVWLGQACVEYSSRDTNSFIDLLAKNGAAGDEDVLRWCLT
ncbi:hypothetical protein Q3G72_004240 [Acer saccharum]|nr:hypothetical protein Q3G72_004240 [Acer saccharum]